MVNSNYERRAPFRRYRRFSFHVIIRTPGLTLRGRRRSKVKVDLEVLGMGSY